MNILSAIKSILASAKEGVLSAKASASTNAEIVANNAVNLGLKFKNIYRFECRDAFGNLRWAEEVPNMVMDGGANDLLNQYFKGSAYTAAFYVGLVDNASFSALATGDTMASHAGWLESSAYSNANRPSLTLGSVASRSVDNTAAKAVFNINATATINGAFVTTNNTKGGTTGTLYGAASFGTNRSVLSGDTLSVSVTLTA